MDLRIQYGGNLDHFMNTESSRSRGVEVQRVCIQATASSCTNSGSDASYAFMKDSTGVGFNQQAPALERLIKDANLMIKLAAKLPYDPSKDLEIDQFLTRFEGDLTKSKPIRKKHGAE